MAFALRRDRNDCVLFERIRFDRSALSEGAVAESFGADANGAAIFNSASFYSRDFRRADNYGGDQVSLARNVTAIYRLMLLLEETRMSIRPVKRLTKSKPTLEGAGVHLRRAFGFGKTSDFDPFLLLDDFRNDIPEDYLAGFPWHPHRGIETITYVLAGEVAHGDSMGNSGSIGAGDVQWMTAGSGIIHQEMPKGDSAGRMHGFQLWANLPAALKMTAPRYQEVKAADIPVVTDDDGTQARIICGSFWGTKGPVDGIAADPMYLDVSVPPGKRKALPITTARHAFAYVFAGSGKFCNASGPLMVPTESVKWLDTTPPAEADDRSLVLFDSGDEVVVQAGDDGIRFLLVSGEPLKEPVAWYGPIVMNTQEQLQKAFEELREGTFLNPPS